MEFVAEIRDLYEKSFHKFANELMHEPLSSFQMHSALENAFLRYKKYEIILIVIIEFMNF